MKRLVYIVLLAMLPAMLCSCERESFVRDGAAVELAFSADTLAFDTVFTTVGTATQRVTVYNRTDENLLLSAVTLEKGRASRFRLNVDGDTAMVARDVEIEAGDSIFIFVQANINPNDNQQPFLVEDAISFSNGQRLPLTAWGRNAVYHITPKDSLWLRIGSETWSDSLPHIVLGNILVSEDCMLRLLPGTEVHFGDGAMLIIDSAARLVAQGTAERPILFTSLRHDGWYSFLPGQWQTIWFYNYSTGNVIDHAVIENGTGGLRGYPGSQLAVSNTVFRNMSDCAIIGQGATVTGRNLLVYDCLAGFTALMGGNYDFRRCTFANYWSYTSRKIETIVLSNMAKLPVLDENGNVVGYRDVGGNLERADFTDCIVWGTYYGGEVLLSEIEGFSFNRRFLHSIVKGGEWNEDPLFTDPAEDDYTLQEDSPAIGIGYQFPAEK